MRKTQGSLVGELSEFNELNQPLSNPFQDKKKEHKSKRRGTCLIALWLMSNILTFTAGYYVKTKYFNDNCLVIDDGSV